MRLLLVEDDRMIGDSLVRGLGDDGYHVDWVRDGVAATAALADPAANFALVLLDWGLPRQDGMSVLRELRARHSLLPVLMITARDTVQDRVQGLDAGADDYLVKPFALAEVKARIRSLLRRQEARASAELVHGGLELDPVRHEVRLHHAPVAVTPREFALLRVLLSRPGAVHSRTQLEQSLYGWSEAIESNVIEVIIHTLRRKLGAAIIDNVRGVGWRIGAPP
ncbi:MAG TPA: response regulator transcription factor [Steroidobacteraceae bacterium]|nr:response regulator transcription factor [Steroidobacteraceae bacterium]